MLLDLKVAASETVQREEPEAARAHSLEGEVKQVVKLGAGALEILVLDPVDVPVDPVLAPLVVDLLELGLGPLDGCLLYTSPSPRDLSTSRMPSSA